MSEPKFSPGSRAWALAQLRAGKTVRKVLWCSGPYYELDAEGVLRVRGVEGADDLAHEPEQVFADPLDRWELHPPAPMLASLAGPCAWILLMFPRCGGMEAVVAAAEGLRLGNGADFAASLRNLWTAAGDPERGARVVDCLTDIDRGVFRRSLHGDMGASALILRALTRALDPRAIAPEKKEQ